MTDRCQCPHCKDPTANTRRISGQRWGLDTVCEQCYARLRKREEYGADLWMPLYGEVKPCADPHCRDPYGKEDSGRPQRISGKVFGDPDNVYCPRCYSRHKWADENDSPPIYDCTWQDWVDYGFEAADHPPHEHGCTLAPVQVNIDTPRGVEVGLCCWKCLIIWRTGVYSKLPAADTLIAGAINYLEGEQDVQI